MDALELHLLPPPRRLERRGTGPPVPRALWVRAGGDPAASAPAARRLARDHQRDAAAGGGEGALAVDLAVDPALAEGEEGYRLEVDSESARVVGGSARGLHHGVLTLAQVLRAGRETGRLAALAIEDRPDLARRGVLLDVSRSRVPTLESLFELVELLSSWKIGELTLYTEHTFAYRGHERVWRGADPLTPDEVRTLDAFCAERFVELVPNQQSFGHMHRWLAHEPYRALAECPDGVEHPFSPAREPFSLCPGDPRALALLADLYDQLLACFASRRLHAGLDETFDLGRGRSRAACAARGPERGWLDHLRAVHRLAAERGRRLAFWADVPLARPELLRELPDDAIPHAWGYEADHPFERDARALAAVGREFVLCPGTSSWLSLVGRSANATANVLAAARAARAHGAAGLLVTDWGDRGHLQPAVFGLPGFALAAAAAWNGAALAEGPELDLRLAGWLDRTALADRAGVAGAALLALGRAGEVSGGRARNASPLFRLLLATGGPWPPAGVEGLTPEGLERAREHVERERARFGRARIERPDAALLADEVAWAAELTELACRIGAAALARGVAPAALPADLRAELVRALDLAIREHRRLWPARSRPGGLEESAAWLERVRDALGGVRRT
jgi:hypothetical protein